MMSFSPFLVWYPCDLWIAASASVIDAFENPVLIVEIRVSGEGGIEGAAPRRVIFKLHPSLAKLRGGSPRAIHNWTFREFIGAQVWGANSQAGNLDTPDELYGS